MVFESDHDVDFFKFFVFFLPASDRSSQLLAEEQRG